MKAIVCSLVLACAMTTYALQTHFEKTSVRSDLLKPLRENKTFETLNECNFEVHNPYGILEHTFTDRLTKDAGLCMWKLHAPENHIIHVISMTIDLEDEIPLSIHEDGKVTKIYLFDGMIPGTNELFWFSTEPEERYNPFVQSLSSGQDMMLEIEYHHHEIFATQKIAIKYEFVDIDKMKELLATEEPCIMCKNT